MIRANLIKSSRGGNVGKLHSRDIVRGIPAGAREKEVGGEGRHVDERWLAEFREKIDELFIEKRFDMQSFSS